MTRRNSLSTQLDQNILANSNAIELLTKLHDAINTSESSVTAYITDPETNEVIKKDIITLGAFKSELDSIKRMLNVLVGIDGTGATIATAKNEYKRIFVQDINVEPNAISDLGNVSVFKTDKNWFLDSMLDPLISIEFDLQGKIQEPIRKILSRRFIIDFTNASTALTDFNLNYKNKSNIDISTLVTWLNNNQLPFDIDEQVFDLTPGRLNYRGNFSVLSTENDTLNNKFWFILDTLNYLDVSDINNPIQKTLKAGDSLKVISASNNTVSSSVYTIDEVSTTSSNFKARLTRRIGIEPVPIRIGALSIESPVINNKSVKISVGYDENCVVFVKPVSTVNNISANNWSLGTAFFSSDLKLDTVTGTTLKDYYLANIYDYSLILKDLVAKKIPTANGIKPSAPVLNTSNFKVVQINKHLTDTSDSEKLRNLHNTKNTLKTEIDQINDAILTQQRILNTRTFKSDNEKTQVLNDLSILNTKKEQATSKLNSVVNEILANKTNVNSITPKYNLRGFWPMPNAVQSANTLPQEVVQFEIYYRYANKNGSISNVDTFKIGDTSTTEASFSPWIPLKTDARKRTYNSTTGQWVWEIQDVSNADTPNINQLDIPIATNEQIQFKIRSISEVGWPDTLLYSDFTDIMTVTFPEDLSLVLADDQFLLNEASQDDMIIKFRKDLNASGLSDHLSSAFKEGDVYWPHSADKIASGFRDNNGKLIDIFTKLTLMQNDINILTEKLNRAKGELRVSLLKNNEVINIYNDQNLEFLIQLEDLGIAAQGGIVENPKKLAYSRAYINDVALFKDYSIRIDNAAVSSPLAILSNRIYSTDTSISNNTLFAVQPTRPQALWLDNNNTAILSYSATTSDKIKTQINNQFVWLQNKRSDNTDIYAHSTDTKYTYSILNSLDTNLGINENFTMLDGASYYSGGNSILRIDDKIRWNRYNQPLNYAGLLGTLHPSVKSLTDIQELSTDRIKILNPGTAGQINIPLNLYWKFSGENNMFSNKIIDTNYFYSTTDFSGNEIKKNLVLQAIMSNLIYNNVWTGTNTTFLFRINGTGYVTAAASAGLYVNRVVSYLGIPYPGPGANKQVSITAVGGELTNATSTEDFTGYNIGDIFYVTQTGGSATGAYIILTDINGSGVAKFTTLRLNTLVEFGLEINDMMMIEDTTYGNLSGTYSRIKAIDLTTNKLTTNYNSTYLSSSYNGLITMLTKVNIVKTGPSDSKVGQVWNSIGKNNNQHKPINSSIFIIDNNNTTSDTIKRTVRFLIESENLNRSFQFSITFVLKQFNDSITSPVLIKTALN